MGVDEIRKLKCFILNGGEMIKYFEMILVNLILILNYDSYSRGF